ncbi:MAG: helix-turn-helix domain-containing protein [Methanoregulaceae archaeon]|jgi:excisionase family DNA binding protein|nr:MAG: Helix-turn-helix domain protein [Firmicutes bacterium ADurb.Bin456]
MPVEIAGIKMYSAPEVAKALDLSLYSTRKYIREGRIKAKKLRGNRYYVSEEHLREFLITPDSFTRDKEEG